MAAIPEEKTEHPVRLIKKYPNRRLYDTKTSSYITLADVKQMVLKNEDFQVLDAKSGDELTRQILLQIILEEESGSVPIFFGRVFNVFDFQPVQAATVVRLDRGVYESAGIDDDEVGAGVVGRSDVALGPQLGEDALGINQRLGTAERYEPDFRTFQGFLSEPPCGGNPGN